MFKIINKENHYYIGDSVTGELLWRYTKSGFSLERVKEFVEKFNLNPDNTWNIIKKRVKING